jgi:hypothetical protein
MLKNSVLKFVKKIPLWVQIQHDFFLHSKTKYLWQRTEVNTQITFNLPTMRSKFTDRLVSKL